MKWEYGRNKNENLYFNIDTHKVHLSNVANLMNLHKSLALVFISCRYKSIYCCKPNKEHRYDTRDTYFTFPCIYLIIQITTSTDSEV